MRILSLLIVLAVLTACNREPTTPAEPLPAEGPIQLHPENPHYFLYKGEPLALITSAEHYGAVLNLDFDYRTYLETLAADGMNYTRIFTGSYFEIPGESFGIQKNTLAPEAGSVITPWTTVIPDFSGKVQYDLTSWNEAYFDRLKDFMTQAAERDIIVEVTFFSSIYRDEHWDISPQNPANNINMSEEISRRNAHTLNNGPLFEHQERFVRKLVQELNGFDNFFFEIQNEPWADRPVPVYNIVNKEDLDPGDWTYKADFADEAAMAWQDSIAAIIADAENGLPKKHLIAQNYTNFKASIPAVSNYISIINFHYAWPEAVEWNYHYDKVIGFDESGFAGSGDAVYRRQAWQFMFSGGGLFNNLDYSFFAGSETGDGENNAPGGGSPTLRRQLKTLSDFLHSFDLPRLHPNCTAVESAPGLIPYILSDDNRAYAVFLRAVGTENTHLHLKTGNGAYQVEMLNTITGTYAEPVIIDANDGLLKIDIEIPEGELALKLVKE